MARRSTADLRGRRVLITGAARGIGAALAERLHRRGARPALAGLEPEALAATAARAGAAPHRELDVRDREATERVVQELVDELGGLDVVVAMAGVAVQLPLLGGDPAAMERTIDVNVLGTYYTLRAAGPHVAHPGGYALAVSSLGAALHLPLLGAYSASKAAVEAIGNTLRQEVRHTGARVGVAYFAELDTEMTSRGFGTEAARALLVRRPIGRGAPLRLGIDALEHGVARRSRRIVAPARVGPLLPLRMAVQPLLERAIPRGLPEALDIARREGAALSTDLPDRPDRA